MTSFSSPTPIELYGQECLDRVAALQQKVFQNDLALMMMGGLIVAQRDPKLWKRFQEIQHESHQLQEQGRAEYMVALCIFSNHAKRKSNQQQK